MAGGSDLEAKGFVALTPDELDVQRNSFIRETSELLDMNFKDKYVIIEFTDRGEHK